MELFGGGGGIGEMSCAPSTISCNSKNPRNLADFEAIIEDLDKELADNIPTLNLLVAEVIREIKGKEVDEVSPELVHGFVEMLGESEVVGSENVSASMQAELGSVGFSVGWAEVSEKRKNGKIGHSKHAPAAGKNDGADLTKEHKNGTWTRLPCRPNNEQMLMDKVENLGPKRKAEGGGSVEESVFENEKKHKVDDETKRLSILFAIHLGSVEVAW